MLTLDRVFSTTLRSRFVISYILEEEGFIEESTQEKKYLIEEHEWVLVKKNFEF